MTQPITSMEDEEGNSITIGLPETAEPATDEEEISQPEPSTEEAPSPEEDESKYFIRMDRRKLSQELTRLYQEDPETANVIFSHAGRKTAERYQARMEELEVQRQAAVRELERREILALPDEEIEKRFGSDPAFARKYTEIVHANPQEAAVQLEINQYRRSINDAVFGAIDYGLPEQEAQSIYQAIGAGYFDRDTTGRQLSLPESLAYIQKAVLTVINDTKRTATPPPPKAAEPQAALPKSNPALTGPGPDTSSTGSVGARPSASSLTAYQRALRSGGKLPSVEEIDAITAQLLKE